MKVAALYDIHGNLPALEAVFHEIAQFNIDFIIAGGDILLGPMPGECLDRLFTSGIPTSFIRGNCENAVLKALANEDISQFPDPIRNKIKWTADSLQPKHINEISKWPATIRTTIDGVGDVLFCHATPESDTDIFTHRSPRSKLKKIFESVNVPLVVCGHTHIQFDLHVGKTRIVNAGSVGMPFGKAGAYWVLLDDDVAFRHTPYNYIEAAQLLRKSGYPESEAFAHENVLNPPSEEYMLRLLEKG